MVPESHPSEFCTSLLKFTDRVKKSVEPGEKICRIGWKRFLAIRPFVFISLSAPCAAQFKYHKYQESFLYQKRYHQPKCKIDKSTIAYFLRVALSQGGVCLGKFFLKILFETSRFHFHFRWSSLADIGTNCLYIEEIDFMLWSRIHRAKFRRIDLKTHATTHALSFRVWHIGTVEFAYSQIGHKYLVPKVVTWITSPVDKDTTT